MHCSRTGVFQIEWAELRALASVSIFEAPGRPASRGALGDEAGQLHTLTALAFHDGAFLRELILRSGFTHT